MGLTTVSSSINRGKGFILRKTFKKIILDMPDVQWIITFDADGQHDYRDIPQFLSAISKFPKTGIFVGKRNYSEMPKLNRVSNILTTKWCKYWLKWGVDDLQCGFRCYNAYYLRKIMDYGLTRNKFDLETELLFIAWIQGIRIAQIPIRTVYGEQRRRSRIIPTLDTIRWVRLAFKFGFKREFMYKIWLTRKKDM
jgi:hypothetical protein